MSVGYKPEKVTLRWSRGRAYVRWTYKGKRHQRTLRTRDPEEAQRRLVEFLAPVQPTKAGRWRKHVRRVAGYVYFIASDCGRIKIGWSRDPEERLLRLNQGPRVLTLLATALVSSRRVEHALHRQFAAYLVPGKVEWFEPNAKLLALAEHVRTLGVQALLGGKNEPLVAELPPQKLPAVSGVNLCAKDGT